MDKKTLFLIFVVLAFVSINAFGQLKKKSFVGAWSSGGDTVTTVIFTENYFSETIYSIEEKNFISTTGGSWSLEGNQLIKRIEFHSSLPGLVGETIKNTLVHLRTKDLMVTTTSGVLRGNREWTRVDDGQPGELAGAWLITGRMKDDQMQIITPGARRTMKILSGKRFQWIAYNVETQEFHGTGGGTYTTEDGMYNEHIEFFSRDNNRVGATLQFDFSIENGHWHHKGLSSKGDPINEIWTKREKIGL